MEKRLRKIWKVLELTWI
ncbi:uncharacterized protein CELE_T05A8.11 [Caenorhabditis elegans]|uniref:Uncharacterized protein n=1 Tax=Caenorhabditis elegans TaxID=6239 RepID=A0A2K5ATS0_CAEEL|nr:Uncharacterized protein CELE_T05A8.11 [Caenorhabditis elegans]SPC47302.2 Uncharacterized protein CELE_T05A8.11 [Caenorhabditis elegans]|eukprot:NP_001348715.2 Uncharacterized protein CELE_T05A8.11 [Caenorhabditis elegans]